MRYEVEITYSDAMLRGWDEVQALVETYEATLFVPGRVKTTIRVASENKWVYTLEGTPLMRPVMLPTSYSGYDLIDTTPTIETTWP